MTAAAEAAVRPQDRVVRQQVKRKFDWSKIGLGTYFGLFLVFLYLPVILMAVLSFQGFYGGPTWPFVGPLSLDWWRALWDNSLQTYHATDIHTAVVNSLELSLTAGAIVSVIAFSLSMAFRRRWRFKLDAVGFYVVMLALMTPGFLLAVGTQLFWKYMDPPSWMAPNIWHTALGENIVWGIPFGFLVMLAVWNRYDPRVEEAARDLGANSVRTFREVTLPLVWTGIFGCFLFGFTLTWNDYDRSVLFQTRTTDSLPLQIGGQTFTGSIRPDLYALGTATTAFTLLLIAVALVFAILRLRFRAAPVQLVEEEFGVAETIEADTGAEADG